MKIDISAIAEQAGMKVDQYGEPSFNRHYSSSTQLKAAIDLAIEALKEDLAQTIGALEAQISPAEVVRLIRSVAVDHQ